MGYNYDPEQEDDTTLGVVFITVASTLTSFSPGCLIGIVILAISLSLLHLGK